MTATAKPAIRLYPVILSGGSGSRLWPISRADNPKQLRPLITPRTMLQETAARFSGRTAFEGPVVVCNEAHRFIIAEQLREIGATPSRIVLEPMGRNTAPAIASAAVLLAGDDPAAVMLVLPADHLIRDLDSFHAALEQGRRLADEGCLVTFGVVPESANTELGYIRRGAAFENGAGYAVAEFVEKPDAATAADYLASGDHYWNSGIFLFRAQDYLDELATLAPDIVEGVRGAVDAGRADLDFFRLDPEGLARCPSISIDYAVMEQTARAAVVPVEMGWNDIGSWAALWTVGERDGDGNVIVGDVIAEDTRNSYIRSETALLTTVGVEDLVIVEARDAVLVAHRDHAHKVKAIVERLETQGRREHREHPRVYRPWGYYETIEIAERHQVKHLMIKPKAAISLQMHHHRAEHWVVVRGTARVTRGEETFLLSENESSFIPIGMTHRLENPGKVPLSIIEVQSGHYLGEDDIVRFEDKYARVETEKT